MREGLLSDATKTNAKDPIAEQFLRDYLTGANGNVLDRVADLDVEGYLPEYTLKGIELVAGRSYSLVMEWNKYNSGALATLEWIDPFGDRTMIRPGQLQLPLKANRPKPSTG
jgi:hypothetical protein